ncbi:hypothetical protein Cni_G23895 [Canna indica]|uniref:Late embryogenesis abundant protein LEA-2 subgroup domain-containing protein n=1 Tax=Canna indica TaxID=4628 RepID=A0AAQ3KUP8_9LILI|nr:hypothetical protein Cni_G23895 [Canna indica]
MSSSRGPCGFCLTFLLAIGFLSLYIYVTYHAISPRYDLTVFSLSTNTSAGAAVASFELDVANRNKELGVYHDNLNLSLSFTYSNSSSPPSATAVVPGFYQGHRKTASKGGSFASSPGRRWPTTKRSAVLLVTLESAVRYKALAWRSRRHRIRVAAEVSVDSEGKEIANNRIRLRSGVPPVRFNDCFRHSILAVVFVACVMIRF